MTTPRLQHLRTMVVAFLIAPLLTACAAGPAPVHVGEEECAHCRMVISDRRYAAQLMTVRGKPYKFDSIECLAAFMRAGTVAAADIRGLWATDAASGADWIPVDDAVFLRSDALRTPMGGGLAAYAEEAAARADRARIGGELVTWADLLADAPAGHTAHGGQGHGS